MHNIRQTNSESFTPRQQFALMDNPNYIVVRCPKCKLRLSLRPVPGYELKTITCPQCHYVNTAGQYLPDVQSNPIQPRRGAPTQIINSKPEVMLRCTTTGQQYILDEGNNTVGREASKPMAKFCFRDPDGYMSRLHASISVDINNDMVYIGIRDHSFNGTWVNERRIDDSSTTRIMPGSNIRMGSLEFVCDVLFQGNRQS